MKKYTKKEIKKIAIDKYGKDYEMLQGQIEWFIKGFNEALRIHDVVGRSEQLTPFKCPNCGNDWNIDKVNSCECGASVRR